MSQCTSELVEEYRPFYCNLFVFRFNIVGYGCMTCIGNSGPLPEVVGKAIEQVRGLFCKFIHVIKQWQSRTCRSYYICKFDNDTSLNPTLLIEAGEQYV